MPYMIYQQYISEIKRAYAGHEDLNGLYSNARSQREWLEALQIDEKLRSSLVEPIAAVEAAFLDLLNADN
jgi:hypothetical protein